MYFTCDMPGFRDRFAKDPCVVRLGDRYFLYYSVLLLEDGAEKLEIGIAVSSDMETWTSVGCIAPEGEVEARGIGAPGAFLQDGVIHLFYQTYGTGARDAICHAMSRDGIHFERDETNPVFRPGTDWCCGRAIDADVVAFGDRLYLYFATRDHAFRIQKLGVASAALTSDFSRMAWRQELAQAILTPELPFEGECIEAPATLEQDGLVYLFYGGAYNCSPQQIGVAVSRDGIHFDKLFSEPFLPCGEAGSWNSDESGHPYLFRDDDGRTYLFYQGTNDKGKTWYLSRVEITFADGRPVLHTP